MKRLVLACFAIWVGLSSVLAQAPSSLMYQGRVSVGAIPFTGFGQFKFAIVNAAGNVTYWSHDNTSAGGGEPVGIVIFQVANGLFSVELGKPNVPGVSGMLEPLTTSALSDPDARLRVWFNDGVNFGFQRLSPDRPLSVVATAHRAGIADGVVDGAVTESKLAAGLGANLARLDASQTFSGAQDFPNAGNHFVGSFAGDGSGLVNLPISAGTISAASPVEIVNGSTVKLATAALSHSVLISEGAQWVHKRVYTPDFPTALYQLTTNGTSIQVDIRNFAPSGPSAARGLVPSPPGVSGNTRYLREDGQWVAPPNTGTALSVQGTPIVAGNLVNGAVSAPPHGVGVSWQRTAGSPDVITGQVTGVSKVLNRKAGDVQVVNSTDETTLYSVELSGGALGVDRQVKVRMSGDCLNDSGGAVDFQIRVMWAGNEVYRGVVSVGTSANRRAWQLELSVASDEDENLQEGWGHLMMGSGEAGVVGTGSLGTAGSVYPFQLVGAAAESAFGQFISVTVQANVASPQVSFRKKYASAILE